MDTDIVLYRYIYIHLNHIGIFMARLQSIVFLHELNSFYNKKNKLLNSFCNLNCIENSAEWQVQ